MRALVAVDLRNEPTAARILRESSDWAQRVGAVITLLYNDELRTSSPDVADIGLQDEYRAEWERIQRDDEAALKRLLASLPEAQRGGIVATSGMSAAEAIIEYASDADIVVLATNGRKGLAHWWVGSVAEQVVRACPKPLLVLRAPAADR